MEFISFKLANEIREIIRFTEETRDFLVKQHFNAKHDNFFLSQMIKYRIYL